MGSGVDYDGDLACRRPDGNNRCLAGLSVKVRQRNSRSSALISNIDASALAVVMFVMFVLVFAVIFLTATPHHGVSADLPKVWHPIPLRGANREDALTISILRDGRIYFGTGRSNPRRFARTNSRGCGAWGREEDLHPSRRSGPVPNCS